MIELNELMLKALATSPSEPLWLVDPETKQTYVLLRKEEYDLVKSFLGDDDDLDGIATGKLIADAMREDDENDSVLDSYQEQDKSP